MKFLCGLLVFLAPAAWSQSVYDLFGTEKFHRAYLDAKTKDITFEPFQELNWDAKARGALPWLNLDRPTPGQIARLSTFESAGPQFRSVEFRAPLDPAVNRAAYLLIHATGVSAVQPAGLKGSVNFEFDARMTAVQRRTVSGTVAVKPSRPVNTAAFVITGTAADVADVRTGAKFEKRKQAGPAVFDFADGGRTVSWTTESKEQPDSSSAMSFRLAGQPLLLVKWNSEFCSSVYTLFSIDATLKPIAGNDYDCDP